MILSLDTPREIKKAIDRIEQNLECLKNSNFCFKEKKDLRKIYIGQMVKYKKIQLSFYTEFTN
jgi:hypothetical protein